MRALLLAGVAVLVGAGGAHASYIGHTIQGTLSFGPDGIYGGQNWSSPTIAAPGTFTFSDAFNTDRASFTDGTTFTITDVVRGGANGFGMTFQDLNEAFTSISLVSSDFSPGLTSSISNGIITVGWTGTQTLEATYTAVFSVTGATAVPEPATLALLGIGVAGIAASRRRHAA